MTLKQNVEIVEKFIKENLSDHYYAYAIHDKMSSLEDDETHHIHVHIMLSPRFIDDIELKGQRQISKYFAYPWRASAKDQSEEKGETPALLLTADFLPEILFKNCGFHIKTPRMRF